MKFFANLLYWMTFWVAYPLFYLFFGLEFREYRNIPRGRGVLIVANHASNLDPIVLSGIAHQPLAYMAKESLFRVPFLGWLITQYLAFPVKRGMADRGAIRGAVEMMNKGFAVGMFPEGTRSEDGRIGEGKPGPAMVAAHANVPVVPVAIWGTQRAWGKNKKLKWFTKIITQAGRPLDFTKETQGLEGKEAYLQFTRRIMEEIEKMYDEIDASMRNKKRGLWK